MFATEKACRTCKVVKPLDGFWRDTRHRDGRFSECKECSKARNSDWCRDHAEERRQPNLDRIYARRRRDPMVFILRSAKHRSKKTGLEFNLTIEDVPVPTHCPVLGAPLARSKMGDGNGRTGKDFSPSLDRIDNTKGYVRGNVIVVSLRANRLKSDATVEELEAVARFYRRLIDDRGREGQSGGAQLEVGGLPPAMPEVLARPAQEERPVPPRDDHERGDLGDVFSLRLQRGLVR